MSQSVHQMQPQSCHWLLLKHICKSWMFLHLCTSALNVDQIVVPHHGCCGCDQIMTVPTQKLDSQTEWCLDERSAKLMLAEENPLLALQSEAASGQFGLLTGAEEEEAGNVMSEEPALKLRRVISKGGSSCSCWTRKRLLTVANEPVHGWI